MSTQPPPSSDSGSCRRGQRARRPPKRLSSPSIAFGADFEKADLKAKPLHRPKRVRLSSPVVNYDEREPIVLLSEREIWQVFYQRIADMRHVDPAVDEKAKKSEIAPQPEATDKAQLIPTITVKSAFDDPAQPFPREVPPSPEANPNIPQGKRVSNFRNVSFTGIATTSPLLHVSTDGTNDASNTYTAEVPINGWHGKISFSCINPLDKTAGIDLIITPNGAYELFEFGKHDEVGCRFQQRHDPVKFRFRDNRIHIEGLHNPKGKRVSSHRKVYFTATTTPLPYLHIATDATNTAEYIYGTGVALDGWHGKIRFSCVNCGLDKTAGADLIITPGGSYELFEFGKHRNAECLYLPLDNPAGFHFHDNRIHIKAPVSFIHHQ
uniref:Altered inheritance of mitochondria protein 24, mitochondrial n=1 Tax=Panagrellus redivivus TaxID=6233 RepID=A0A7E4V8I4_PANRE